MNISFFNFPISNTLPRCRVTVKQIYEYIISGRAKEKTLLLRSLVDGGVRRAYKAQNLDYVTFSGCFSVRKIDGLISHSGFMCFDIDHIDSEERLQEIKSKLINDELLHTVLIFRSPSGNGLKWVVEVPDRYWLGVSHTDDNWHTDVLSHTDNILHTERTENTEDAVASPAEDSISDVLSPTDDTDNSDFKSSFSSMSSLASQDVARRIDTDLTPSVFDHSPYKQGESCRDVIVGNHRVLYERIRGYLFEQYGIETDHTSDIARPCYLCHDVDAYYDPPTFKDNPASKLLTSKASSLEYQDKRSVLEILAKTNKNKNDYENDIEKIVRHIEHRRIDITNDYHDWMLVAMALAGTYGSAGQQYFHQVKGLRLPSLQAGHLLQGGSLSC